MRRYDICAYSFRNVRAANDQRDVNVLLVAARFPRLETVLPNMEAVIGGIDNVGVVQDVVVVKAGEETIYELVNGLKGTESLPVEVIVPIYVCTILLGKVEEPCCS